MLKRVLFVTIVAFIFFACTKEDPTEPDKLSPTPTVVPTVTPTVTPTITPAFPVVLIGHFVSDYLPSLNNISVILYQGKNIFNTTTDITGAFNFGPGLVAGSALITGTSASNCCWTSLPITLNEGVNYINISVIFDVRTGNYVLSQIK